MNAESLPERGNVYRMAGAVARPSEHFVGSATHRRRSGYGAQEAVPTKKIGLLSPAY